jgi:hypothetical protein
MKNSFLRCAAIAIATYGATGMAAEYRVPRLADGTPDLQGVGTNSSATPLERAPTLDQRRAYTDEEAARVERTARARVENDAKPTDPDLKIGAAALPPVGNYNQFWTDRGMSVAVINGEKRTSVIIDPPDGRIPPLHSQARRGNADSGPPRNRPSGNLGEAFTGPEGFPVSGVAEEPPRDESDPALNGRADGPEQRRLGEREHLRISMPRRQLCAARNPRRRARSGSKGAAEVAPLEDEIARGFSASDGVQRYR